MITSVIDRELGLGTRALMEAFDEYNIESRPFFNPLSSLRPSRSLPTPSARPDATWWPTTSQPRRESSLALRLTKLTWTLYVRLSRRS